MVSNGIIFVPNFVKIGQITHKSKEDMHTHTHTRQFNYLIGKESTL